MLVAFDYDDCLSLDVFIWLDILTLLQDRGHQVLIVTTRKTETGVRDIRDSFPGHSIYSTNGEAKKSYLASQGLHPDVWVDDNPVLITEDAKWRV